MPGVVHQITDGAPRQRRRHFLRNALRLAIASPAVLAYIMSL